MSPWFIVIAKGAKVYAKVAKIFNRKVRQVLAKDARSYFLGIFLLLSASSADSWRALWLNRFFWIMLFPRLI